MEEEEGRPGRRVRLVFDDRHLLKQSQREEGLRRCWLLLRPELATVADLSAYVARRFRLRRSCPDGLLLSIDDFVLPPFESTCIFRDKDIVRVKQKLCKKITEQNDVHCIQDSEIVEKQALPTNGEILAIEFLEDVGRHQREKKQARSHHEDQNTENEDASSKRKRKEEEKPEGSKKKKSKLTNPEESIISSKKDETVHQDQDQNRSKKIKSSEQNCMKNGVERGKAPVQSETGVVLKETTNTVPFTERRSETELNCQKSVIEPNADSASRKSPSRSARRKKAKRQFRQEAKRQLNENLQSQVLQNGMHSLLSSNPNNIYCPPSSNPNGWPCPSSNNREAEQETDISDDIVPVVVRPGHIRFESTGGEPSRLRENGPQVMTPQWNGIMSKKKGQKWGMESVNKKKGDNSYYGRANRRNNANNYHGPENMMSNENIFRGEDKKNNDNSYDESASKKFIAEGKSVNVQLDFESLYPLTRLPKEGDLIVYRLVELSSSWCPELSPYRVGEVLIYDPISRRIILLPVPDFPIFPEEKKDEDDQSDVQDMSLYKEDGSLEVEYSSLIDVRLLKDSESESVIRSSLSREKGKKAEPLINKQVAMGKSKGKADNWELALEQTSAKDPVYVPENIQNNGRGEVGQALNGKAEVQENGWGTWTPNKNTTTSTSSWSYRALRGSALGPTVAFLRGKNGQKGKSFNPKFRK